MSRTRHWSGFLDIVDLPEEMEVRARTRCQKVLERRGIPADEADTVVQKLIDQIGYALAGDNHELGAGERGRPLDGSANILSVVVADILKEHGVRGNWLLPGDEEEDGLMGSVAELEAILQTELGLARGKENAAIARPARISNARKTLGKVHRD
jgi:hypothetical protein